MTNKNLDIILNILLSLFLGIFVALIINNLFQNPYVLIIYKKHNIKND